MGMSPARLPPLKIVDPNCSRSMRSCSDGKPSTPPPVTSVDVSNL